jgi:hypothetical protein
MNASEGKNVSQAHVIAKTGAFVAFGGMGLLFMWLGVIGGLRGRLPMRSGELRGRWAVAVGLVYVGMGGGLLVLGASFLFAPIR